MLRIYMEVVLLVSRGYKIWGLTGSFISTKLIALPFISLYILLSYIAKSL